MNDCECEEEYEREAAKRGWAELDPNQRWLLRRGQKMQDSLARVEDMVRQIHGTVYDEEKGVLAIQREGRIKQKWTLYLVAGLASVITFILGAVGGALSIWQRLH